MAQSSSSRQFLSARFDKIRRVFRNTQDLPGDLQSNVNLSPRSLPTTLRKTFRRRGDDLDARHDIKVLAVTYILQNNQTIRELIQVIIGLDDQNDNKLSETLALSATFTVQLASFHEQDPSKALTAITAFLKTMQVIDVMTRDATETTNKMKDVMNDSIKEIKDAHPSLSHRDPNIGHNNGLSGILDTIIGTSVAILDVFNEASGFIPVPFVEPLVSIVASLLTAVQQTRSNVDDMRQVATVAGEFVIMLAVTCAEDGMKPSPRFQQALNKFQNKLEDIAKHCNELSRRNVLWRFFQQGVDQNSLLTIKDDLQNAVQQFQTEAQVLQSLDLRSLGQVINGKLDEDAVNSLPKTSYVSWRDEYLPGSRSDVIQDIADWLGNSNQLTFWMRGGAGLGKSTLAHEIVNSLLADSRLATFAFLVRGFASDPATVIQMMARELSALHPRAIPEVAVAVRTCNSSHRSLCEYMESYIINPIRSLSHSYPLVIVVDALDEWEHHQFFLQALEYISQPSLVKILLISRPNYSIERSLLKVPVQKYDLPPVSQAITEQYFNHHFARIDWKMRKPSEITISNLARLADGLLIWAATVCSFLSYDMRPDPPHKLLEQILSSRKQIVLEGQLVLSNLYDNALKQLFRDDNERELFRRVFGGMTVLQESLPVDDFARILGMSDDQVRGVQSRLTALQTRGTFNESTVPPVSERFHSSFIEFTLNRKVEPSNSLLPYSINLQMAHESIGDGCLTFLNDFLPSFRGNKCSHSDLRGLELYAVKFWPLHVANSNDRFTPLPPKLENLVLGLSETHLRQWGSWFLTISLPGSSYNWDEYLSGIDKDGFYCSLADFLRDNMSMDTTIASRRTSCLEIAVRLQPQLAKTWEDLGDSYKQLFHNTGTLDMLNSAIIVYRHGLKLWSKDVNSMFNLANALRDRFRQTSSMTDLEEAISMFRESLPLCPAPHPDHSSSLTNLASALQDHFKETGSMTDLEEAISMFRESLSLRPAPHSDRPFSLINLASVLHYRFNQTGSMTDLEEAIVMHRESLSLCPAPHPDRSSSLIHLASALHYRFGQTGLLTDLEEAISMSRESLSLCRAPHPDRPLSLITLASSLHCRFKETGSITDLEEAILMHRESLSLRPAPHPDRPSSLINLASVLHYRFNQTGSMTDLEEAIVMHRESLSLRPAPHPERYSSLNNFASALHCRFRQTGSLTDLEEAISMSRESLSLCPTPHPYRPSSLINLTSALLCCFNQTGSMTELEEAISMFRESLSLCPAPHPDHSFSLSSLTSALQNRFKQTSSMTDLEDAISMLRESLSLSPAPFRIEILENLCSALETRFEENGDQSDLNEVTLLRQELTTMSH